MSDDRDALMKLNSRVIKLETQLARLVELLYIDDPQIGSASLDQGLKELHYELEGF